MRISDVRYDRDLRRYNLAWRMIQREVRTKIIFLWTGLSRYRIQTLFTTYRNAGKSIRHRGKSPCQIKYFSKSLAHECESSAFTYVALQMDIIPAQILPDARSFPSLARGERLTSAFDLYQTLVPDTRITLEYAMLLMTELARRTTLTLGLCQRCDGLMIVDQLGVRHTRCAFCRLAEQTSARANAAILATAIP